MRRILFSLLGCLLAAGSYAQQIAGAEYYVDTDPGPGNGTALNAGAPGSTASFSGSIATTGLPTGFHLLVIRAKSSNGSWSHGESRGILIANPVTTNAGVVAAEYFVDADPGQGNATAMSIGAAGTTAQFSATLPTTSLTPGFHFLAIRTKDATGRWGLHESRGFYIGNASAGAGSVVAAEYFVDSDPGQGNATAMSIGAAGSPATFAANIPVASLAPDFHFLAIRAKDASGRWSHFETRGFYIAAPVTSGAGNITAAEYFVDADPGQGNATALAVSTTGSTVSFPAAIPTTSLSTGFHFLAIRVRDADGQWSLHEQRGFYITDPQPSTSDVVAGEYFVDTDPGLGNATPFSFPNPDDSLFAPLVLTAPGGLSDGAHTFVMRVRDANGRWSLFEHKAFTVGAPVAMNQPGSGNAIKGTGATTYLTAATNGYTGIQTYTIECWVRKDAANTDVHVWESNGGSTPSLESNSSTGLNFWVGNTNSLSTGALDIGEWHHIACVYDKAANTQKLYVDGVLKGTNTANVADAIGPNLGILARAFYNSPNRFFNGAVDEFRVWRAALTQDQIRERMCRKITVADPIYNKLAAYYNFDEASAPLAYDQAGGNHATLVNTPQRVTSGAAIGNISAYAYAGNSSSVTLTDAVSSNSLQASMASGTASGIQVYGVTEAANTYNGMDTLADTAGYFGVFVPGSNNAQLATSYHYASTAGVATENSVRLFRRADNAAGEWLVTSAAQDPAANNLSITGPAGEWAIGTPAQEVFLNASASGVCAGTALALNFQTTGSYAGGNVFTAQLSNPSGSFGSPVSIGTLTASPTGSNIPATINAVVPAGTTPGSGYQVRVISSNPALVSNVNNLSVTSSPTAGVTASGSLTFCSNNGTVLTADSAAGYTWQWRKNGIAISGATGRTHVPTLTGSYTVVVAANGCSATSTPLSVTVNPAPNNPTVIAPQTAICSGSSTTISRNNVSGLSYQWLLNGGSIAGATGTTYAANAAGSYSVQATSSSCTATSATVAITMLAAPVANVAFEGGTSASFCPGGNSKLIADSSAGNTFQWKKNGINITGATQRRYMATTAGSYVVQVSGSGCSAVSAAQTITVLSAPAVPVLSLSGNSVHICPGDSILINTPSVSGLTYQWYQSATPYQAATPTGPITGATSEGLYAKSAHGTVNLRATNSDGCFAVSASKTIYNYAAPSVGTSPASSAVFCNGGSVILTASPNYPSNQYQWYLNGTPQNGATTYKDTVYTSGTYRVRLTNANGCNVLSGPVVVNVVAAPPTPAITASGPLAFCPGGNVLLTVDSAAGYTFLWKKNGVNIAGATQRKYIATQAGSYTVIVSNGSCASTSLAKQVTVNPLPVTSVSSFQEPLTRCMGDTVLISSTPSGYPSNPFSFQWQKNGVSIPGATNASLYVNSSGTYQVAFTNANGCTALSSFIKTYTFNSNPVATITPGSYQSICAGSSVVLSGPATSGLTYQWYKNGSAQSGQFFSKDTVTTQGNYTLKVTNAQGCSDSTSPGTFVATVAGPATPVINASTPLTFCTGGNVLLITDSSAGYSFQWKKNGVSISGATQKKYTANSSGTYTVQVKLGTCTATSAAKVVTANPNPAVPVLSPAAGVVYVCPGDSLAISTPPVSGCSYQWYRVTSGLPAISGATAATYFADTSDALILLTVTDANGCKATSAARTITDAPVPTTNVSPAGVSNLCNGSSLNLSTTAVSGSNYQWYRNDTAITGATSNAYTASNGGSYTAVVTNSYGCTRTTATKVVNLLAAAPPVPVVIAGGSLTFCSPGSVLLTSDSAAGYQFQWKKNGVIITGATTKKFSATASGSYTVQVSTGGCTSTSAAKVVTVNTTPAVPAVSLSPTAYPCAGTSVTLSSTPVSGLSYQWYNGNSAISGATGTSYTMMAPANTVGLKLRATSNAGCFATSNTKSVYNGSETDDEPQITPEGPATLCSGSMITGPHPYGTYTGSSTFMHYTWYRNGVEIPGEQHYGIDVTQSGTYTYIYHNDHGCDVPSPPSQITVLQPPATPVISAGGPTTFCPGGSVTLSHTSAAVSGASYLWRRDAFSISGATSASYSAGIAGAYRLDATGSNGCKSTSSPINVTVLSTPAVSITASGSTTISSGQTVTLNAAGSGITSYAWRKNSVAISGATNSSYTTGVAGQYTVTATGSNGCTRLSNIIVVTVSSGGKAPQDTAIGVTGIGLQGLAVTLLPNPTSGYITVLLKGDAALIPAVVTARVISATGALVYQASMPVSSDGSIGIELPASLAAGIYTLSLEGATGPVTKQRITLLR